MAPSDFVVKVDLDGDMRRFRLQATGAKESTWAALREVIHRGYELTEDVKLRLTYQDDEGDTCTLTETTFPDCVAQAGAGPIRLRAIAFMPTAAAVVELHTLDSEVPPPADHDAVTAHPGEPTSHEVGPSRKEDGKCSNVDECKGNGKCKGQGKDKGKGKCKMMWWAAGLRFGAAHIAAGEVGEKLEVFEEAASVGLAEPGTQLQAGCVPKQTWSPGPWKLLTCLGGLKAVGRFNAKSVASLAVYFLPTLAERAGQRQARLNQAGTARRESLLPMLHRILVHLEPLGEAGSVKQSLEAYCSGEDVSKLGETLAALLHMLVAHPDRASAITVIKGVSEELVDLLPQLFPRCFAGWCMPAATHVGARCAGCDAARLVGPKFHDTASGADFCCECFVDQAPSSSADFTCLLWSFEEVAQGQRCGDAVWDCEKGEVAGGSECAAEQNGRGKGQGKGKCQGKGKGKGKLMWWTAGLGCDATQKQANTVDGTHEVVEGTANWSPSAGMCPEQAQLPKPEVCATQCWSPGPRQLVACLGGLHAIGRFNAKSIASLALYVLPALAEYADRRQARLNQAGTARRELLLPVLDRVLVHLEAWEEAGPVKQSLEAYCSGKGVSKFGETLVALLKMLAAHPKRPSSVALIKGVSEELVDLLPQLFPRCFAGWCMPAATHAGARCACCDAAPLMGPRFHDAASGADFCCECFVDKTLGPSADFTCHWWSLDAMAHWRKVARSWVEAWQAGIDPWAAAAWSQLGAKCAAEHKGKAFGKGKCKGKGKGKGKGKMMWCAADFIRDDAQPADTNVDEQAFSNDPGARSPAADGRGGDQADPDLTGRFDDTAADWVDCSTTEADNN